MIDNYIDKLNQNKLFVGLMVVVVAVGGRFIRDELNDSQRNFIHNSWVRRLFVFGVCFMATRDICISSIITMIFVIVVSEFTNKDESSRLIPIEEDKLEKQMNDKKVIIETINNQLQKLKV